LCKKAYLSTESLLSIISFPFVAVKDCNGAFLEISGGILNFRVLVGEEANF
jgi:hypothetical protein